MVGFSEAYRYDTDKDLLFFGCDRNSSAASWLAFNGKLEQGATPLNLSERWLSARLAEWSRLPAADAGIKWLSLCRVNELTLLCAGNYVDSGELAAAGDLLVNPRLTLVHLEDHPRTVVKERHGLMSEQFAHLVAPGESVCAALTEKTRITTHKKPILAEVYERLESSGIVSKKYLLSACLKMRAICEAITFIAAWHLPDGMDLQVAIRTAPAADRDLLQSKLCHFDKGIFNALGDDLQKLFADSSGKSVFLR